MRIPIFHGPATRGKRHEPAVARSDFLAVEFKHVRVVRWYLFELWRAAVLVVEHVVTLTGRRTIDLFATSCLSRSTAKTRAQPTPTIDDVLKQAGDVSGKVIMTCSLPMNTANTELVIAHESSGAEELARRIPRSRVVSAFGTIPSEVLFGVYESRGRRRARPSLLYCGDDDKANRLAAGLAREIGFDPVDAGPLRIARYMEPFALLVAQLAYEGAADPELAYRFEHIRARTRARH